MQIDRFAKNCGEHTKRLRNLFHKDFTPNTLTAKEKQKQLVRIEKFLWKCLPDGQLDSEGRVTQIDATHI